MIEFHKVSPKLTLTLKRLVYLLVRHNNRSVYSIISYYEPYYVAWSRIKILPIKISSVIGELKFHGITYSSTFEQVTMRRVAFFQMQIRQLRKRTAGIDGKQKYTRLSLWNSASIYQLQLMQEAASGTRDWSKATTGLWLLPRWK